MAKATKILDETASISWEEVLREAKRKEIRVWVVKYPPLYGRVKDSRSV